MAQITRRTGIVLLAPVLVVLVAGTIALAGTGNLHGAGRVTTSLSGGDTLYPPRPQLCDRIWQATFSVSGGARAAKAGDGLLLSRTQPRTKDAPRATLAEPPSATCCDPEEVHRRERVAG